MLEKVELDSMGDVELVMAVEETFDISLEDHEAEKIETVGDLYQLVLSKLPKAGTRGSRCMTAMAFYRLRRAIRQRSPGLRPGPGARLDSFISKSARPGWWRHLESQSGLNLPGLSHPLWTVFATFALITFPGIVIFLWPAEPLAYASILGILLVRPIRRSCTMQLPWRCDTLADLTKLAAVESVGILTENLKIVRAKEIWETLEFIIQGMAAVSGPLGPETRFDVV